MKLLIKLEDFSKTLYNDPYAVDTKKKARELIKALNDNLKALYQQLEDRDDFDGVDVYQVGDVINLLDAVQLETLGADKTDWTGNNNARKCTHCGKKMREGYYVEDNEYYCTDGCLYQHYTAEEYDEMYQNNIAYWTEWED